MRRQIIERGISRYRLIGFEFRDHADGSFYVELKTIDRPSKPGSREKISYHATGRVKFSGPLEHVAFYDPIFALANLQEIATVSLPDLDVLEQVADFRENDTVLSIDENQIGRINLHLFIGPDDDAFEVPNAIVIGYAGWFRFHLAAGGPLPVPIAEKAARIFATSSRYEKQALPQSQALIFFHQKRTGEKAHVFYWDTKMRLGRLIFAIPMRTRPSLIIELEDPSLTVELQEPLVLNTSTAELRFKVKGPKGYLNQPPIFKRFALDAEL